MENNTEKYRQYLYYVLIGFISLIALIFLPMLGSDVEAGLALPTTRAGWAVWIITRLIVAIVNILLFICFVQQGKINVEHDERYLRAVEEDNKLLKPEQRPRSPTKMYLSVYGKKGVSIFLSSILSAFVLTQAILSYDYTSLITYAITISLGAVFGVMQMMNQQAYWTEEYPKYVMIKKGEENNGNN